MEENNTNKGGHGEKKPRLMISKMELENFKSYAGVQPIGPFHKCFSSIVGPNGSGKSNVIDALLFVFGARAKQLRLNKVSELVHKSSQFPKLDYARVSVYFQLILDDEASDEDYEVVPGSHFTISRVAYTNNTSKYTIDNRTSSFTEVGTLLRSHGVDLDNNRFLILQGEVEQIAMMKPKGATEHEEGLLEYLEDIIGSNQLVPKIEEASKALDVVNEQRVDKVHRLKVAEKERDNLYGSKVEAEEFLEKEKTIRQKRNLLFQVYSYLCDQRITDRSQKLQVVNTKLADEKTRLTESENRLHSVEKEYDSNKAEHAALESELQKASVQYDSFERKDIKLQEDLRHSRAALKKQEGALNKEEKKLVDVQKDNESLTQQITKSEQIIADFTAKKSAAEDELNAQMMKVNDLTQHIRVEMEEKQQLLAQAEKQAGGLFTDKELLVNSINIIQERPAKAAADLVLLEQKLSALIEERDRCQVRLQEVTEGVAHGHQNRLQALEQEKTALLSRETTLQEQIYLLVASIESNKEALANSKNMSSSNKTIQTILQAARCGSLSSVQIVGRLGDLACIESKYDVAINTACKHLNYIVVQRTEDAQQIISYLRDNQLGRASFIVLDQMEDYKVRMNQAYAPPSADVVRVFDLLQDVHSAEVRAAFYMALGNTLVAENLDLAVSVAYNGRVSHRVVTVEGQLIDTSGAMSGGGNEVRKGAIRLTANEAKGKSSKSKSSSSNSSSSTKPSNVTEEMINEQERQLAVLQEELTALRTVKVQKEQEMKALQVTIKQCHNEIEKLQISIAHINEQEKDLHKRVRLLQQQSSLTSAEEDELGNLQSQLTALEAEIARASPNLKTLQQEVNTLQRSILAYGGVELSKINAKIDSYSAQIDNLTTTLAAKRVEHNNQLKALAKTRTTIEKCQVEIEKLTQKVSLLEGEQAEMSRDATSIISVIDEYKAKLVDLEEVLHGKQAIYHDLKSAVAKIKAVEVDLVMEFERLSSELKEENASKNHYSKEISTLKKAHLAEQKELQESVRKALVTNEHQGEAAMEVEEEEKVENEVTSCDVLPDYSEEQLSMTDTDQVKKDISLLEAERNKLKGNVNMNALIEYLRKDALYRSRLTELERITAERCTLVQQLDQLRATRLTQFMQGFTSISLYLKEMYQMLTLGGDAELELIDSLDPFSEGIIFSVRPVKKSWKCIFNLSGGEKTLASLALVFALHYYKPTPLYVMDEIDAALDFKNVSIVANYIKERTKNAQFIIISLRNNMFELADRLVGIYKTHDHTKSITISPKYFTMLPQVPPAMPTAEKKVNDADDAAAVSRREPLRDATNRLV
eukprot:gene4811-5275_t